MIIALASSNSGKVEELRLLLPSWVNVKTASDLRIVLPEETGATFLENALLKARAACEQSGLVAVADDSGLEVDALAGAPGVRSARFAGEPSDDGRNNALLLEKLKGVLRERRTARFRSVVAALAPDGTTFHSEGTVEGLIRCEPVGTGGFGYDPLFQPEGYTRTFAELTLDEKNEISHRGRAFRDIAKQLVPLLTNLSVHGTAGAGRAG